MTKIKICGMMRQEDISFVNKYKPDFVGFILSDGFRRTVSLNKASEMAENLNCNIQKVGVFVNEPLSYIENAIEKTGIDIVQLHGSESPELCKLVSKPVIKVLTPKDFGKIKDYEPYVSYFLFDSGTGTGKTFDWNTIPKTEKPFFLAGGISKDNLQFVIENVKPYAVDMSSSVETNGVKDELKIQEIINKVRSL